MRTSQMKWNDLSGRRKVLVVVAAVAEIALTTTAARDLARRDADEVRGPQWL